MDRLSFFITIFIVMLSGAAAGQEHGDPNGFWVFEDVREPALIEGASGEIRIEALDPNVVIVPEYRLADASLFIDNGIATASLMRPEAQLDIRMADVFTSQALYLLSCIRRGMADMQALTRNAIETNPRVLGPIRVTMGHFVAAESQAQAVLDAARSGRLGPTYQIPLNSVLSHLRNAKMSLAEAARGYDAGPMLLE